MTTKVKITKLMYGWSKWGGGNKGLVKESLDEWACQACGEKQRRELPSYMLELWPREFVRICSKCKNIATKNKLKSFYELLEYVKKD